MKLAFEPIARLLVALYSIFPVFGLPIWINWLVLDEELPPRIATHWGLSGMPDGYMSPSNFALSISIVFAVMWILVVWLLWTRRLPQITRWVVVVPILWIYLGLLNLVIETILAQRGVTEISQVQVPVGSLLFLAGSIPAILGFTLSMPQVKVIDGRIDVSIWAIPIYRIPLLEIEKLETTQLRARDYGGLGFRFGRSGFAIIPRPGTGIRITTKTGNSVSIRCKNAPEILQNATRQEP